MSDQTLADWSSSRRASQRTTTPSIKRVTPRATTSQTDLNERRDTGDERCDEEEGRDARREGQRADHAPRYVSDECNVGGALTRSQ